MPWRTVAANIALPLEIAHAPQAQVAERTEALIALVGLEGFADAYPAQLSGRHAAAGRARPRADP